MTGHLIIITDIISNDKLCFYGHYYSCSTENLKNFGLFELILALRNQICEKIYMVDFFIILNIDDRGTCFNVHVTDFVIWMTF